MGRLYRYDGIRLLACSHLGVLLVLCSVICALLAETIASVLEVLSNTCSNCIVLGNLNCLLEWLDTALKVLLELSDELHVLSVIILVVSLLLYLYSLVVEENTLADVCELV